MKNQYVGDKRDFFKYGILRFLAVAGKMKINVCWMLTQNDASGEGDKTEYLKKPEEWKRFDASLFEALHDIVYYSRNRNVEEIQRRQLIPGATYFSGIVSDDRKQRKNYFRQFLAQINDSDLVFFDPDIGIERKEPKKGRKSSSKYVYWDELGKSYAENRAMIIFQYFSHFVPLNEETLIKRAAEITSHLHAPEVIVFDTADRVAFFLVPRRDNIQELAQLGKKIAEQWASKIRFLRIKPARGKEVRMPTREELLEELLELVKKGTPEVVTYAWYQENVMRSPVTGRVNHQGVIAHALNGPARLVDGLGEVELDAFIVRAEKACVDATREKSMPGNGHWTGRHPHYKEQWKEILNGARVRHTSALPEGSDPDVDQVIAALLEDS